MRQAALSEPHPASVLSRDSSGPAAFYEMIGRDERGSAATVARSPSMHRHLAAVGDRSADRRRVQICAMVAPEPRLDRS